MRNAPPRLPGSFRLVLRLALIAAAVWAMLVLADRAMEVAVRFERPDAARGLMTALGLAAYAVLLALPFVPGVEIGISILVMRGSEMAPYVYGATVVGLLCAYVAGRFVPVEFLRRLASDLRLQRLAAFLGDVGQMPAEERLSHLHERLPAALALALCDWRYVTLALLLNLPGNALVGGGGGIMLLAGLSRLFSLPGIVLTVMLAVMPVPLGVWFLGSQIFA